MYNKLKIIHHEHSGRLRPHEHTSYVVLSVLVLFAGIMLALFTFADASASPGPEGGSIGLTGTVPSAPPNQAAIITSPTDDQRFNSSPITVSGTCVKNMLIEIYKNDIFAGSGFCDNSGRFSIQVDLLFGKNNLKAIIYDALNQAGPDSNVVTVFYDVLPQQIGPASLLDLTGAQMLLDTDAVYRGKFPNQSLNVPLSIIGGTPPFAINVNWGDSTNNVIPRGNNSVFNTTHVYKKAGIFNISFQGTDSKQLVAFLTVAAIINGQPAGVTNAGITKHTVNKLLMLWPFFAIAITLVVSFWVGEQREKRLLNPDPKKQGPQFNVAPQAHP